MYRLTTYSAILAATVACGALAANAQGIDADVDANVGQLGADADANVGDGADASVDVGTGGGGGTAASADADVGGQGGVSADADAGAGGPDGLDATANIDAGGGDGANADADISLGGDETEAEAEIGIGDDAEASASIGAGGDEDASFPTLSDLLSGDEAATDSDGEAVDEGTVSSIDGDEDPAGTAANGRAAAIVAGLSDSEIARFRTECADITANSGRYDRELVELCAMIDARQ